MFSQAFGRKDELIDPAAWIWRSAFRIAAGLMARRRHDTVGRWRFDPGDRDRCRAGGRSTPGRVPRPAVGTLRAAADRRDPALRRRLPAGGDRRTARHLGRDGPGCNFTGPTPTSGKGFTRHEPRRPVSPLSRRPHTGRSHRLPIPGSRPASACSSGIAPPHTWPTDRSVEPSSPAAAPWPMWRAAVLAAAAVVVLAAALVALLPDGGDGRSVVADSADGPRGAGEQPSAADRPGAEDRPGAAAERDGSNGDGDDRPVLSIEPDDTSIPAAAGGADEPGTGGEAAGTTPAETSEPETEPTQPPSTVVIDDPKATPTIVPPKETMPPESQPPVEPSEPVVLRGIVTEVFTDCQSRLHPERVGRGRAGRADQLRRRVRTSSSTAYGSRHRPGMSPPTSTTTVTPRTSARASRCGPPRCPRSSATGSSTRSTVTAAG